jgi:hypothetical protein
MVISASRKSMKMVIINRPFSLMHHSFVITKRPLHNQFKLGATYRNEGVFNFSQWLANTAINRNP